MRPGPVRNTAAIVSPIHILRSCTIIRISAQLAWSAINAIPFAPNALLPYGLTQEEAYDHRTDFIS
jgi:hypothetical protein